MRALGSRRALCGLADLRGAGSGMRFLGRRSSEPGKRMRADSHLVRLAETAQEVFREGRQATPGEVERIRQLMAAVPLEELGLQQRAAAACAEAPQVPLKTGKEGGKSRWLGFGGIRRPARPPIITFLHICETPDFALGIFCLPTAAQLPLHDHPGMTVFTRVMYGQLQVEAYDWLKPANRALRMGEARPARPALNRQLGPEDLPVVLFPSEGGNLHCFTAARSCAVLDLLAPPYDPTSEDRGCSYYSANHAAESVMLKRIPVPESFRTTDGQYTGVQLQ